MKGKGAGNLAATEANAPSSIVLKGGWLKIAHSTQRVLATPDRGILEMPRPAHSTEAMSVEWAGRSGRRSSVTEVDWRLLRKLR
jgi:hypothetical protein